MYSVTFPGGVAVDTIVRGHTIHTDQPATAGGADSGPSPFDLFLASLTACAGYYALRFCQERHIPTEGLGVTLTPEREEGRLAKIRLDVTTPPEFPVKYRDAILRAVDHCAVKRAIVDPPAFDVRVVAAGVSEEIVKA
jgi:ribosomal protein S12 methylthiotransferase accessory factor